MQKQLIQLVIPMERLFFSIIGQQKKKTKKAFKFSIKLLFKSTKKSIFISQRKFAFLITKHYKGIILPPLNQLLVS